MTHLPVVVKPLFEKEKTATPGRRRGAAVLYVGSQGGGRDRSLVLGSKGTQVMPGPHKGGEAVSRTGTKREERHLIVFASVRRGGRFVRC